MNHTQILSAVYRRLKQTAASSFMEEWAKPLYAIIKAVDSKAPKNLGTSDGHYTSKANADKIKKALSTAGYPKEVQKDGSITFYPKGSNRNRGMFMTPDEDSDDWILYWYDEAYDD